jgi:ABC-2 type transport system permease protein
MHKLLSIELTKLFNYTSFKVILGLHLALFSLVVFVTSQIDITVPGFDTANLFRFPHIWSYFAWVASWFNLLLAILIIMITGNEFAYRTFRQHVIDGLSRMDLLKGKLAVVFLIAVYSFLLVLISGIVYGLIYSSGISTANLFTNIDKLFIFFLQTLAYMVIGLMLVVLLRSTALSIILFILLRFPVEPIIRTFFDSAFRPFFPMKSVSGLTPMPEFLSISSENSFETLDGGNALSLSEMGIIAQGLPVYLQILVAVVYTSVFLGVIAYVLKNRNL